MPLFSSECKNQTMQDNDSLIEELEAAISAGAPEKRLNALTRITDLFIAGTGHHSQDVIDLFDDVLSTLTATIEVKALVEATPISGPAWR